MIEVKASLIGRNVYVAGEQLHCIITLTNVAQSDNVKSTINLFNNDNKDDTGVERLAWSTAQIHCQCVVNESRINVPQEYKNTQRNSDQAVDIGTYFAPNRGDAGHSAYLSKPQVLCCDLILGPGVSKTFHYVETLPYNCPPSYRGNNVKYAYKLSIGFQKLHSSMKLLRIPMRVININGVDDMQQYMETEPTEIPTNPFLSHLKKESSFLDNALEVLSIQASRRNLGCYSITSKSGLVGKFILYKVAYRLGEDIVGYFDFAEAQVSCLQQQLVFPTVTLELYLICKHDSEKTSLDLSKIM
ncbi:uncharacterized protein TRIADDRAFT_54544 [Trichoplax adhaerens]|uniref:Arrestin C-terminal-like domain-containing protein n=1 Tax=Trichoplax adhaerens TaxID=10228 RepID=B3RSC1_TRIAD|nr:hypothetical protein TRIADDRAFT_54544 [Trichoplax adhaerens]EDV26488.1 hypothetical protein TRIADDRAFT_54544 [Trichoplax adhaerens]|eukprot:XP_002110484.1 hypothetical protein TRIADDRAFT_54544 [Trichoplax adhaerens]